MLRVTLVLCTFLISGCALYSNVKFETWHGKNEFIGKGGTKQELYGIELWRNGEPPKKFVIIGVIEQSYKNDALGLVADYSQEELSLKVKKVGGDGIILISSEQKIDGYHSQINNYGYQPTVTTSASTSSAKKYIVFKY